MCRRDSAKSYYTEIRKISDDLCRKYGLSIIESDQKKSIPYVQWKAEPVSYTHLLPLGTYYLKEVVAGENCVLNTEQKEFTLTAEDRCV